jgi:hypothetical protein
LVPPLRVGYESGLGSVGTVESEEIPPWQSSGNIHGDLLA